MRILLILVVSLSLFTSFATSFANQSRAALKWHGVDLRDGTLGTVTLEDKQKAAVLIFLSARCPSSLSHESKINRLAAKYSEVTFLGIHSNADEPEAPSYFSAKKPIFPVFEDREFAWANQYGALKTPHVFILNPKGQLIFSGGVDDSNHANEAKTEFLETALKAIRNGKAPPEKIVRALGCVIERQGKLP